MGDSLLQQHAAPGSTVAGSAADSGGAALFRQQVVNEHRTQWLGTVMIVPRRAHRCFAAFAACAAAAILALLFFGSYASRTRVSGWLVPEQGIVRVHAPQKGIATDVFVREGQPVTKGQPLFTVSTESHSVGSGATQSSMARDIGVRRRLLVDEVAHSQQRMRQQDGALAARISALRDEEAQVEAEMALQARRVELAAAAEQRERALVAQGYLSEQQALRAKEGALEQQAKLQALRRTSSGLARERLVLEGDRRDLPLREFAHAAGLERAIAELDQELAAVEAQRGQLVSAPEGGIVTAIQAAQGSHVDSGVPMLTIVPREARLQAHLYAPSRAVGFVGKGQPVLLRYEAYPFQKFGHHAGTVVHVSRAAIHPREMAPPLAGPALPGSNAEPVYRITVLLERQAVLAYGKAAPLQAGMQVTADLAGERRRLIEWMLDPLHTLSGNWKP